MASRFLDYFLLSGTQLAGLLSLIAVALALKTIGAAVGGRNRLAEADLVVGWAVGALTITAVGAATTVSFRIPSVLLLFAALSGGAMIYLRGTEFGWRSLVRIIVLAIPAVILVGDMVPAQWDEFGHWLPTAQYLVEHDTFPRQGYPPTLAGVPGYPEALPIVTYWTSLIAGRMVENASALFNLLLLLSLAALIARLIAATTAQRAIAEAPLPGWGITALGMLFALGLNPTFVPKVVLTSYGDASTSVCVAFAAVLAWSCLNDMADEKAAQARRFAWQAGMIMVPLVLLKQGNVALLAAVAGGYVLVSLRDPAIRVSQAFKNLACMLALPLFAYALWRYHVMYNLPGRNIEFQVHDLDSWNLELIPQIVAKMAQIALKKGGYFAIMAAACVCGVMGFMRSRTPFHRFAVMAGAVFVAYNLFLLTAYVVTFGEYDALRAASYWRYNIHLGGVAVVFLAFGCALLWRRYLRERRLDRWRWAPIALVLILPVALAPKIRFDQRPQKLFVRAMGDEVATLLPPRARIALLDPRSNGYYQVLMRYALPRSANVVVNVNSYSGKLTPQQIREYLDEGGAEYAWVHIPTEGLEKALGVGFAPATSYLLRASNSMWEIVKAWPFPGYTDPAQLPD